MIWLGIESSCDETAAAVLRDDLTVLSNPLYSQIQEHQNFGGVVPEIAARAHLAKIQPIVESAVQQAGITLADINAIAYTRGPGLMGPLLVGASYARGLGAALQIPTFGINHLEGHIAAAFLSHKDLTAPFLALTVSGGHTEILQVHPGFEYSLVGRTRDDAAGEAFDKCGKLLGLGYPAGPVVSKLAQDGDRKFVRFPQGLRADESCNFSFSGLKTAVLRYCEENDRDYRQSHIADICASLETAIVDILVRKCDRALAQTQSPTLVLCGGVSANRYLRLKLGQLCEKRGVRFASPDLEYCTDNGAMIAAAAILRYRSGMLAPISEVKPWLPLA